MGNKRRVWWIVGGLALALVIFAGVFIPGPSEQKLEQNLLQVASDFGFSQFDTLFAWERDGDSVVSETWLEASMTKAEVKDLVSRLGAVCKGWDTVPGPSGTGWVNAPRYEHDWIVQVTHDPRTERATINITKYEPRPGTWERVKRLWPW